MELQCGLPLLSPVDNAGLCTAQALQRAGSHRSRQGSCECVCSLVCMLPMHVKRAAAQTGLKYGLPLLSPVDDAGLFTAEAGPFQGKAILGEGNAAIAAALRDAGHLLKVCSAA